MAANPEELHLLVRGIREKQTWKRRSRHRSRASSRSSSRAQSPFSSTVSLQQSQSPASSAQQYVEYTTPSQASKLSPGIKRGSSKNTTTSTLVPDLASAAARKTSNRSQLSVDTHTASQSAVLQKLKLLTIRLENIEVQQVRSQQANIRSQKFISNQVAGLEQSLQFISNQVAGLEHKQATIHCVNWTGFIVLCGIALASIITVIYLSV